MSEQRPDGQPAGPDQGAAPPGPPPDFPPPQVYAAPAPQPLATPPQPYGAMPQPYGAVPPAYGAMPPSYGAVPQPYAQPAAYPGGGAGYPMAQPYGGYPQPAPTPGASIALVVVSGFFVLIALIGVPSLVIGIVALTRARSDPDEAKRLTWIGWLVLGILVALVVVIVVIGIAVAASTSSSDDGSTIGALGTTVRPLVLRST